MFKRTAPSTLHGVDGNENVATGTDDRVGVMTSAAAGTAHGPATVVPLHRPQQLDAVVQVPERPEPRALKRRLATVDLLTIVAALGLALIVQEVLRPAPADIVRDEVLVSLIALPLWMISVHSAGLYTARLNVHQIDELKRTGAATLLGTAAMAALAFVLQVTPLSRLWLVSVGVCVFLLLATERRIARWVFASLRRRGRLARRVLIVGSGSTGPAIADAMRAHREVGYEPVGLVGEIPPTTLTDLPVLSDDLGDIERLAATHGASSVLIPFDGIDPSHLNALTRRLTDAGLHVTLSSSLQDIDIARLRAQELDGRAMFYVEPTIRTGWRRTMKRLFDVSVAAVGLLLASPVLLLSAALIKLESRGPVMFRQERVGQYGHTFEILKLRTMVVDAEARRAELADANESDGPLFKIRADPRITRVGRVLRKLSIDEIPQFWNVLRGEMSVVGPRPALPSEVEEWATELHHRLQVLPGITGMWQVSGRSDVSFEEYKRLDFYYVDNWSLRHDVGILCKTFAVVLRGRGAS